MLHYTEVTFSRPKGYAVQASAIQALALAELRADTACNSSQDNLEAERYGATAK